MKMRYLFVLLCPALVVLTSCDAAFLRDLLGGIEKKPSIKGIRPSISKLDFKGVDLMFDVDVMNPYGVAIKSPSFTYGLKIQETDFMQSSADTKVDLPANKVGTLKLPVRVGYMELWKSYQGMKDKAEVPYTFQGSLAVPVAGKTFNLPLKTSSTFPVLRMPKFSVQGIDTSDVSFSSAKLKINAAMTNPNIFALNAGDLGYALKLGDLSLAGVKLVTDKSVAPGKTETLSLVSEISGLKAVQQLLKGDQLGGASLRPTGAIKTPYGAIKIPE